MVSVMVLTVLLGCSNSPGFCWATFYRVAPEYCQALAAAERARYNGRRFIRAECFVQHDWPSEGVYAIGMEVKRPMFWENTR